MMMTFSLLAALEVVMLTTSGVASKENFINVLIFPFQCKLNLNFVYMPWLHHFHILLFFLSKP